MDRNVKLHIYAISLWATLISFWTIVKPTQRSCVRTKISKYALIIKKLQAWKWRIIDQYSIKVTWKLFTFSLIIFTICLKLPFLPHGVLWTPKIQNLYILTGMDGSIVLPLHFSGSQSVLFKSQISHLWNFNPSFMMIYSYFHDEVVEYRLNPHGYGFDFVSDVDCNTFLPREFYAQYENQLHSLREWSVFS